MPLQESHYGHFGSSFSLVLAAAGVTIGLGNVWGLAALASGNGGSAFLLLYAICLIGFGLPLLISEWALGRWMRGNVVWGVSRFRKQAGQGVFWSVFGWLALIGGVVLLSYLSVVAGWSLGYVFRAAGGGLSVAAADASVAATNTAGLFLGLTADAERSLAWHTLFMLAVVIISSHGPVKGLQRAAWMLVPTAVVLVIGWTLVATQRGDASAAASQLFGFRPAELSWRGALGALSLAFFTLSLGVGTMMAYGGYIKPKASLVWPAVTVLAADLAFALACAFGVLALLIAAGRPIVSGTSLMFVELPVAFSVLEISQIGASAFYVMTVCVALATAIGLLEPIVVRAMERFRVTRIYAACATGMLVWFLGLITLLAYSVLSEVQPGGYNIAQWLRAITQRGLVPIVAAGVCLLLVSATPLSLLRELWGSKRAGFVWWLWLMRYPARIGLLILIVHTSGLTTKIAQLWGV